MQIASHFLVPYFVCVLGALKGGSGLGLSGPLRSPVYMYWFINITDIN